MLLSDQFCRERAKTNHFARLGTNFWSPIQVNWANVVGENFPPQIKLKYVLNPMKHLTLNRPIQDPKNRPITLVYLPQT